MGAFRPNVCFLTSPSPPFTLSPPVTIGRTGGHDAGPGDVTRRQPWFCCDLSGMEGTYSRFLKLEVTDACWRGRTSPQLRHLTHEPTAPNDSTAAVVLESKSTSGGPGAKSTGFAAISCEMKRSGRSRSWRS